MSKFSSRLALIMSAAALVVVAACSNGADDQIAAPGAKATSAPKINTDFGGATDALIQVCVAANAPSGPYSVSYPTPTNYVFNTPEQLPVSYEGNDILQPSAQTNINPGECRLLFTKVHGTPDPNSQAAIKPFLQSFLTMTITNTNGAQAGGTFTFKCIPSANFGSNCADGAPTNLGDQSTAGTASTVTAGSNPFHGSTVTFSYTPPIQTECTLGYPDNSNLPRSNVAFNESEVLAAYAYNSASKEVRAWYTDEHALLLGQRQIVLKIPPPTGTLTFNHSFPVMGSNPGSAIGTPLLQVGSNVYTGDGNAADPYGRPLSPMVFVTDLSLNPGSRVGDWQQGGTAYRPNKLFGTWKGNVATVDYTKTPAKTTYVTDANPAKNNLNLGAGANPVPAGVANQGYSAEIVWSAASLGLDPTHNYRLQFMIHDGDQNKTGGDVGQACMNIGPNVADRLVVN
jgi:hypothetical protein